ncbi:MAG: DUF3798 domain-containing protein [Filifactoraceae bacterium]
MKKFLSILLASTMLIGLAGCSEKKDTTADSGGNSGAKPEYKIGILTGTVSQGEEEYRAAEKMKKEYGDMVVTATYPDNFSKETETTIAQFMSMASDPDVKAIVFCQAVPGAAAAIDKAREVRDDLLVIVATPGEDPDMIASKADVVLVADELAMGKTIPEQAKALGAVNFVHYSFPRHMSYQMLAARRDLMKASCKELGLNFVEGTAPDPTGDAGVPGTQQFILEDVPRKVAELGKDTAFFGTNCAMQEPMIQAVLTSGAIYPQQCCPSPYHGYPGALGIEIPAEKQGDVPYVLEQIKAKMSEKGGTGRFSTWAVPVNMMFVEGGVKYAMQVVEGKTSGKLDVKALETIFTEISGGVKMTSYTNEATGKTFDNYLMVLSDFVTL